MRRAAVLGSPVTHSLSPLLHTTAYAALGLSDWTYDRREVTAPELGEVVRGLDESWRGLSLTMPLKEAAFAVADGVSDIARRAGAVNTLVRRPDGGWGADNTDIAGIVAALAPHVVRGRPATVLGSGATARSALLALAELGCGDLRVRARGEEARSRVVSWAAGVGLEVRAGPLTTWEATGAEVVVSTLPPAGSETAAAILPARRSIVLLDVVYANWPTPLARAATMVGMTAVCGVDMLVHQAARQFELFTGAAAPTEEMLRVGRAAAGLEC